MGNLWYNGSPGVKWVTRFFRRLATFIIKEGSVCLVLDEDRNSAGINTRASLNGWLTPGGQFYPTTPYITYNLSVNLLFKKYINFQLIQIDVLDSGLQFVSIFILFFHQVLPQRKSAEEIERENFQKSQLQSITKGALACFKNLEWVGEECTNEVYW